MSVKISDIVFNNISENEALLKLNEERNKILNEFAKAYLAETNILPSEVELVSIQTHKEKEIETVYFFRKKVFSFVAE